MINAKIIYWGMVATSIILNIFGYLVIMNIDKVLEKRVQIIEQRFGNKTIVFFKTTIKVLSLLISLLSLYLLFRLIRILPCALK